MGTRWLDIRNSLINKSIEHLIDLCSEWQRGQQEEPNSFPNSLIVFISYITF